MSPSSYSELANWDGSRSRASSATPNRPQHMQVQPLSTTSAPRLDPAAGPSGSMTSSTTSERTSAVSSSSVSSNSPLGALSGRDGQDNAGPSSVVSRTHHVGTDRSISMLDRAQTSSAAAQAAPERIGLPAMRRHAHPTEAPTQPAFQPSTAARPIDHNTTEMPRRTNTLSFKSNAPRAQLSVPVDSRGAAAHARPTVDSNRSSLVPSSSAKPPSMEPSASTSTEEVLRMLDEPSDPAQTFSQPSAESDIEMVCADEDTSPAPRAHATRTSSPRARVTLSASIYPSSSRLLSSPSVAPAPAMAVPAATSPPTHASASTPSSTHAHTPAAGAVTSQSKPMPKRTAPRTPLFFPSPTASPSPQAPPRTDPSASEDRRAAHAGSGIPKVPPRKGKGTAAREIAKEKEKGREGRRACYVALPSLPRGAPRAAWLHAREIVELWGPQRAVRSGGMQRAGAGATRRGEARGAGRGEGSGDDSEVEVIAMGARKQKQGREENRGTDARPAWRRREKAESDSEVGIVEPPMSRVEKGKGRTTVIAGKRGGTRAHGEKEKGEEQQQSPEVAAWEAYIRSGIEHDRDSEWRRRSATMAATASRPAPAPQRAAAASVIASPMIPSLAPLPDAPSVHAPFSSLVAGSSSRTSATSAAGSSAVPVSTPDKALASRKRSRTSHGPASTHTASPASSSPKPKRARTFLTTQVDPPPPPLLHPEVSPRYADGEEVPVSMDYVPLHESRMWDKVRHIVGVPAGWWAERVRACAGEEAWVAEEVKVEEELGEPLMLDEHVVESGAEALHMEVEVTQFQQQDLSRSHPRSLKAQTQTTSTPVVGPPGLQAPPDIASAHTQTYQDTSLSDPTAFLNLTSTGALDVHAQTPYASRMHLGADFSSAIDVGAGPVDAVIGGYALTEADMQAQAFVHPARAETFLSAAVPDTGQAWMGVAYEDGKDDGDVGETYQDPDGERDADGETDLDAVSDRSVHARSGSNVAAHSDIDMVASVGMDMDTGVARQVSVHASTEKSLSVVCEMDFGLRTGMDNPGGSFGYEGNGTIDPSWLGRTGPEAPSPEKNAPQEESAPVTVVSSRRRAASRGKGKQRAVVQSSNEEAEDPVSYTSDENNEYGALEQQKAPKTKLKASARSKAKSKAIPKSTSRRGSTSRTQIIVDEAGPSRPQLAKQTKPRRSDVTNANMREAYKPVNIFAEPVIVIGKRQRKPTARLLAHKTELPRSRSPASSEDSASTQSGDNAVKSPARSVTRSVSPGKGKRSPNKQRSKADRSSTLDIQLSFCHQCRNTSAREKMKCSVVKESGEPCGLRYCIRCVVKRYPEIEFDPLNRSFVCPRCSDSCCCDACCRKRGETYIPPPRGYVDPETLEFIPKDPNEAGHGMLSPSPDYSYETPDELPPNGADAVENGVYWGAVYSITGQRIGGGFIGDGKRGVVVKTTPLPPSASIQSNGATDRLSSPSSSSSSGSEVDGEVGKRLDKPRVFPSTAPYSADALALAESQSI